MIEKELIERQLKNSTTLITLQKVFFALGILLTTFLIIQGVIDWKKLFDILK